MKKVLIIFVLFASVIARAQDHSGFVDKHLLGKGKTETLQLSLDVYPFLFLSNGGGGSAGIEFSSWQIGVIGFSVVPPDFITQTFFQNMENVKVGRNNAVELFASYYLRKDRKGIYTGIMGGPEWFMVEDQQSGARDTIVKTYLVPRLGIRVFPFNKYVYADTSFGWSFNLSGTESRTLGLSTYNASAGGFIYFLQIGARFNLTKSPE